VRIGHARFRVSRGELGLVGAVMKVFVVLVAGVALFASEARACSMAGCNPPSFAPASGRIPANATALYWIPSYPSRGQSGLSTDLVVHAGNDAISFDTADSGRAYQIIRPTQPLVEGTTYRMEELGGCAPSGTTFEVGPPQPPPMTLGDLSVGASTIADLTVFSRGGGCVSRFVAAQADVEIVLSPHAAPWSELLFYRTIVDEKPWDPPESIGPDPFIGGSWKGRGKDRLFAFCRENGQSTEPDERGLAQGRHTVRMEASFTGEALWATREWTVDLRCDGPLDAPRAVEDVPAESSCSAIGGGAWAVLGLLVRRRRAPMSAGRASSRWPRGRQ
jgi:hypothetical protein